MAIKTYPLNDIDYQAEDAELFHCTRTSGVYASGHFPVSVTGTDNNITIGKGIGWLKNTEFSGKVFASKEETTLNVGVPDASLPRVDAVVVRFDANQNETYFTIKQGSVGSTPTPPEVERGEYIYELHLYHIRRRPGATAITPGDITDLRMDANYCGLMADSVTQVDMSAINAQVREFITDWENQIANVTDGKMIEAPEYPGCYYRLNRGVKEWLNPPMMEDVEYPTTKRQDGKRVYTKLLKARSQAGSVALEDVERIVSVSAVAERDWNGEKLMFQLPVDFLPKDSPTIQKMQIYYQGNTIVFQSVVSKGLYNLYITVEYTKPGDEVAYTNVTAEGDTVNVETNGDVSAQGDSLNVEMFTTISADGGAYIRRLTINGVAYDLAVGQAGSGAPGTAYPGIPGQFYTDLDSGEVYVCMGGSADVGVYIWRTIIPSTLSTSGVRLNHKTGIEFALIKASQGAIVVSNGSKDAVIRGVADPVNANDAANKQYVDSKIGSAGENGATNSANYTGKKILFMGDSITRQSSPTSGWVGIFNTIIQPSSFVNTAVVGAGWVETDTTEYDGNPTQTSNNVIGNQIEKIARGKDTSNPNYSAVSDYDHFDIIIIAAGINDYSIQTDEPDIEDSFTSGSSVVALSALDRKVFASAFRYNVERIKKLYPTAQLFICTPTQVALGARTYKSVKEKRDHIIALCERMSVTYIDTFMCGIYSVNEVNSGGGLHLNDGVHPNDAGKAVIAKYNAREVIKHYIGCNAPVPESTYTNRVPTSINADGTVFNGVGYQNNVRIGSSGTLSTSGADSTTATGFIKVSGGDVVRVSGGNFMNVAADNANSIGVYDSTKKHLGTTTVGGSAYGIFGSTYDAYKFTSVVEETAGVYKWVVPPTSSGVEYIRISCYQKDNASAAPGANLIVNRFLLIS